MTNGASDDEAEVAAAGADGCEGLPLQAATPAQPRTAKNRSESS